MPFASQRRFANKAKLFKHVACKTGFRMSSEQVSVRATFCVVFCPKREGPRENLNIQICYIKNHKTQRSIWRVAMGLLMAM